MFLSISSPVLVTPITSSKPCFVWILSIQDYTIRYYPQVPFANMKLVYLLLFMLVVLPQAMPAEAIRVPSFIKALYTPPSMCLNHHYIQICSKCLIYNMSHLLTTSRETLLIDSLQVLLLRRQLLLLPSLLLLEMLIYFRIGRPFVIMCSPGILSLELRLLVCA